MVIHLFKLDSITLAFLMRNQEILSIGVNGVVMQFNISVKRRRDLDATG